ncbi:sulfite oxidase [Geobacillus sp. 46C-IIa]|nr:sulfite oxidase [Geobacillus sp. 46C-IIa]QNU29479.1 sulfite oxidase [Geobacillus sp. 46C-IIa]
MMTRARPYLLTRSVVPENQESPIWFLRNLRFVPERYVFRRNHFAYPLRLPDRLTVSGLVSFPLSLSLAELKAMPAKTITAVLECAGNQRAKFSPPPFGEQWEGGALSQGAWTGVPLREVLARAGVRPGAAEIVFVGADEGLRPDMDGVFSYARSLPLAKALHPGTMIAYAYNGAPLSLQRGYPLRLIVPGWYGMASVKWLAHIIVTDHPFTGPFQSIDYMYYPYPDRDDGKRPVTTIRVNSLIQFPLDRSIHRRGLLKMEGISWTGRGVITRVEVSLDGGRTWREAKVSRNDREPYAWVHWQWEWNADRPGDYEILVRATDSAGRTQPLHPLWNRKGYGYHAISRVRVQIT